MRLSFYPRGDASPTWPGKGKGDYAHAGRTFNPETRENVVDDKPFEVESHDGKGQLTIEAQRFRELCVRDGDVLPADKATAEFCGVPFAKPVKGESGWDLPKAEKPKKSDSNT
jgi:hypothetical protein